MPIGSLKNVSALKIEFSNRQGGTHKSAIKFMLLGVLINLIR